MPSSDAITIPLVLKLVAGFRPKSILDVGCGNGKYGFLFREILDMNWGRMKSDDWEIRIDGVEITSDYYNPLHNYFYNHIFEDDWLRVEMNQKYDLIFMGDILEHFADGDWQIALQKAMDIGQVVIVVCPNWEGSINQGPVLGNECERHKTALSPAKIGGKCVWANTKAFITVHSIHNMDIGKDLLI